MVEVRPLIAEPGLLQVHEIDSNETFLRQNMPTGTLYDNAGNVPFDPTQGLISVDVQSAIAEVTARYAGGRRASYVPYSISRQYDRIQRIRRVGSWLAGAYDGSEILDTHGTYGHMYPFGAFSAYNARGAPHRDHDRLSTLAGPDLVTNAATLSVVKTGPGTATFVRGTGTWGVDDAYQAGKWMWALGWTNAGTNGRFLTTSVDAVSGELVVEDPGDLIVTEGAAADHEVRGTTSGASGHNGYASGLLLMAGSMLDEERLYFRASGLLENEVSAANFVEIVLEPNPPLDIVGTSQFTGANRMRMNTGVLGATWTGKKRIVWECTLQLGHANTGDEYSYDWRIEVADVLSVGGSVNVTGGFNFKESAQTMLCPRFRVDEITNLDIYDGTYQGQVAPTLLLEFQKLDAGPVH